MKENLKENLLLYKLNVEIMLWKTQGNDLTLLMSKFLESLVGSLLEIHTDEDQDYQ